MNMPMPGSAQRPSVAAHVADGTIDATLAATVWTLVEGHVPLLVASDHAGSAGEDILYAFLAAVPAHVQSVDLRGAAEPFAWMPQATELGWSGPGPGSGDPPVRPDSVLLLAGKLAADPPDITGASARIAIRAAAIGYGLAATIDAASLEGVFDRLERPPVSVSDDERSFLGVVLVVTGLADGRSRIAVAHYLRPTNRDMHGHIQRLGPAVLATWDPERDTFEHFGWGITPELAIRIGIRPGDFERSVERRSAELADLVAHGILDRETVRARLAAAAIL